MKSDTILQLLALKHAEALFVPECKNGPTTSARRGQMRRMDAWVMPKSWRHPNYIGYEIKVSRSDFLQDDKWPEYLPCCNELYFVCPANLIKVEEVAEECGLIWVSATGSRLYTKKKAPHRKIDVPIDVLKYVLICRAKIGSEVTEQSKAEFWKAWLADKEEKWITGTAISKKLQELHKQNVATVESENRQLKREIEELSRVKQFCTELNININRWTSKGAIEKRMDELKTGLPREVKERIQSAKNMLDLAEAALTECTEVNDGETIE